MSNSARRCGWVLCMFAPALVLFAAAVYVQWSIWEMDRRWEEVEHRDIRYYQTNRLDTRK